MSAIEVRDVFRVHSTPEGDAAALQGLSLAVGEGEVVAVLGPSGAGKSTLLRILAGVEQPSAGVVRVFGEEIGKLPSRRLADYRANLLGYVDQHYTRALAPELSARRLVALQLGLRGEREEVRLRRADELLERVGLGAKRDRRPGELSGGEQQRVALCAAVAHRPRVFLADEPTGELDAATADQVYELVGDLVREHGCTTLLVSHDPESAKVADRIIRIRDGRVSEEWARDAAAPDTIVVGRGGWLRLPEELLQRAGITDRAAAHFEGGVVVVGPVGGAAAPAPAPAAAAAPAPPPDETGGTFAASVRGLVKTYGSVGVLSGIDADFRAGTLHAVTGPSGSGKTTFLHLLAGLELPQAGADHRRRRRPDRARPRRPRGAASCRHRLRRAAGRPRAAPVGARERRARPRDQGGGGDEAGGVRSARVRRARRADAPARLTPVAGRARARRDCASGRRRGPGSCSPTSPPPGSTARTRSRSRSCWRGSRARPGPPSSARPTIRS